MKHPVKKILRSMFVGCMLLSATAMSAGATNDVSPIDLAHTPNIPSSTVENVTGRVAIHAADGSVEYHNFAYNMPATFSDDVQDELLLNAVYQDYVNKDSTSSRATRAASVQELFSKNYVSIPKNTGGAGATFKCDKITLQDPSYLAVQLTHATPIMKSVNCAMINHTDGSEVFQMRFGISSDFSVEFHFYDNKSYEGGTAVVRENDSVSVRLSATEADGKGDLDVWAVR